jgi:clan AA aspartic protease (TIGR02281 family)
MLRWLWRDVVEWVLDRDPELLVCACFLGIMCLVAALAVTLSFLWDNSRNSQLSYAPDPPSLSDDRGLGRQTTGPVPPSLGDHGEIKATIDDNNHCVVTAFASARAGSGARITVILDSGLGGALWLTRSDAQSIGVDVDSLDFNERYYSISGTGRSARATISRFRIGGVWLRNVPALVISEDGGMDVSLVGAPILKLLNFRIGGNACMLSW